MEHTPGPWKVRFMRPDDISQGFFVEAKNNNKPDLGYGIEVMGDDFGDHNGYPIQQRLADAKLIAAAPDMLEALINARTLLSAIATEYRAHQSDFILVDEAIKKATE